jgi:hypothetical protein
VHLHDLAAVAGLHQRVVGPHRDLLPDQGVRHGVEGALRADVEVPLDLRLAPGRHPVGLVRDRHQQRQLVLRERLRRPQAGRAVHPHPGPGPGPVVSPPLPVADVQELLAGEEAALRELHPGLDPALVLRGADPRGIDGDAAGLRVLQPLPVPPRLQPVRGVDDGLESIRVMRPG